MKKNHLIVFLLAVMIVPLRTASAQDEPGARYGHTLVTIGEDLFMFGGATEMKVALINELWMFNQRAGWQRAEPLNPPPPTAFHQTVVVNDKMYCIFGETQTGLTNKMWSYDPAGGDWSEVFNPDFAPPPRKDFIGAPMGNGLFVGCGVDADGNNLMDCWYFDLNDNSWTQMADYWPSHCPFGGSSVVLDDKIWTFGGDIPGSDFYNTDVQIFDFANNQQGYMNFLDLSDTYKGMNYGVAVKLYDNTVFFGGGLTNDPGPGFGDYWLYDHQSSGLNKTDGPTLTKTDGPKTSHSAIAVLNEHIFIHGGLDEDGNPIADLYERDPTTGEWVVHKGTGINEIEVPNDQVMIYPNPTRDFFSLSGGFSPDQIRIYSLSGELVKTFSGEKPKYDISDLSDGVYLVRISSAQQQILKKLVKSHNF